MNETSAIEILADLFPMTSMSENDTITYIRQQICDEKRLKELFYFPNETVADDVHDEICNLTADQFYILADMFVQDFNWNTFVTEVKITLEEFCCATLAKEFSLHNGMFKNLVFDWHFVKTSHFHNGLA